MATIRNASMPSRSVMTSMSPIGLAFQAERNRDKHPGGAGFGAFPGRDESPAPHRIARGVVQPPVTARCAQLHLVRSAARIDQHTQDDFSLLAEAARERGIGRRRILEVTG